MDKALKNSTPGNWSRLYLNNWAVPNRRDKVWKDANSFFYWCFHCRRRSRCLRSLMHCIRFWNLFKIWRVLEATYLKLHGKEKSRNKNLRSHLRIELGHFRISHLHISHNTPCLPPKILHNLCFSFSLGYYNRPKRNWWQCLCTILGGQTGCILGWDKIIYVMSNTERVVTQSPEPKAHVKSDWKLKTKN